MKILVTGATGFIGQHLVDRLIQKKHQVWTIVRKNSDNQVVDKLSSMGVKIIVGDLKGIDKLELPTVDCVYHLAALVDTTDIYSYRKLYAENTLPTIKLANYYLGKVKSFVFLSSMSAMGVRSLKKKVSETINSSPKSNYGKSKLEAEKYLLGLWKKEKFPVTIIRPPTVYGPGEHYNFLKLARAIQAKKYWILGNGQNKTSWCFVGNLVQVLVLVPQKKVSLGEVFLIDDGVPYTLLEVSESIAKGLGISLPGVKIPLWLAYPAGLFFDLLGVVLGREMPLSTKRINTLTANFAFDTAKAKKFLGYRPTVKLGEAVAQTIQYFRETGQLGPVRNRLEVELIQAAKKEGLGSVYERIMVKRLFEKFIKKYQFFSVLEYLGLPITKGFDNLTFLTYGKKVTIVDPKTLEISKLWGFTSRPDFKTKLEKVKFDLVWNFATVQITPEVVRKMKELCGKYVLIFVPNFWTVGMPFHLIYHLLVKKVCTHAERGSVRLRTKRGIEHLVKKNGLEIVESGYVDLPLLPDIGFSIRELKGELGIKVTPKKEVKTVDVEAKFKQIQKIGMIERLKLPDFLRWPLAHHIYVLAKVK